MINIKILGKECKKCLLLETNVKKAISEIKVDANIEKISGVSEITNYGVMITPALVIDEDVKSIGKILSIDEIKKLLVN